jgi:hypothetical protein
VNEVIDTYPQIPRKSCPSCGWSWEGEPEQVMRIPFGGNSFNHDNLTLHGNTDYECVNGLATSTQRETRFSDLIVDDLVNDCNEYINKLSDDYRQYLNKALNIKL